MAANISADASLLCQPLAAEHARFDRERRRDLCQGSKAELGERLTYCLLHGFGGRLRGGQFDVRHYRSMPVLLRNRCIRVQTDADGPGLLLPSLRQDLETHHGRRHAGHDRSVHGGSPRRWRRPLPRIPVESDRLRFRTAHARASAHSRQRRNIHIEGRAPGRCGPSHADASNSLLATTGGLARFARPDRCAWQQRVRNSRFGPHNDLARTPAADVSSATLASFPAVSGARTAPCPTRMNSSRTPPPVFPPSTAPQRQAAAPLRVIRPERSDDGRSTNFQGALQLREGAGPIVW